MNVALTSTEMVYAPGILRWAMNGYKFKRDRKVMIRVMQAWPGLTDAEWAGVLSGEIPHAVEGDKVMIEIARKE